MTTEERKLEHIKICLEKNVEFRKYNGFEKIKIIGKEEKLHPDDIDLSVDFLGKKFSFPVFIEAMTGGYPGTEKINKNLAKAAEKMGIGMGVGSQRAMLENPSVSYTYMIRDVAPSIFLLGNIGGAQLLNYDIHQIESLVDVIEADGIAIHINALQEIVQPEGDRYWNGVFERIHYLCRNVSFPVVVKEVGCGICEKIAKKLENIGVSAIDVAGAGGTNWLRIEAYRGRYPKDKFPEEFLEIGLPTAHAVRGCVKNVNIPVIASGGIRTGEDCIKALALGASLTGFALPLLKPAMESWQRVVNVLEAIVTDMINIMAELGVKTVNELRTLKIKEE